MQEQSDPKESPSIPGAPEAGGRGLPVPTGHAPANPPTTATRVARRSPGFVVRGPAAPGGADLRARQDKPARRLVKPPDRQLPGPHLDDAGALGPFAGAGTAKNEHDQRLHEAVRAEEKRPAGHQRETKTQVVQQPAAAAVQHTLRL